MSKYQIGLRIRTRRKDLNLTQERLAEKSNSSVNFISQLERHEKDNVTLKKLSEIANALDISVSELLNYKINDDVLINDQLAHQPDRPKTNQLVKELLQMDKTRAENISEGILKVIHNK